MKPLNQGKIASRNSALTSLVLLIIKGIAGLISGSLVLLSDALDSGFDLLTMIASWFGFKIAQRKPDEKFPYGYYKVESIISLFISLLIVYASVELIISGYSSLFVLREINSPFIALGSALASVITSFYLSRYLMKQGKEIHSQLLISNSRERFTDSIKSTVVLAAIFLGFLKVPFVEGVITIAISLLILKVGLESAKDSIVALMDASPSREIEERIRSIIRSTKGVMDFSNLKLRQSGPFIFGEVAIKVNKSINVKKAHLIADELEQKVRNVDRVDSFIVHVEPFKSSTRKIAIPVKGDRGLDSEIINHFGRATGFLFITLKKGKLADIYYRENTTRKRKIRAGLHTADLVLKEGIDALVTSDLGEISFHKLRDNYVDIYKSRGKKVKTIINSFINGKLPKLNKPTRVKE